MAIDERCFFYDKTVFFFYQPNIWVGRCNWVVDMLKKGGYIFYFQSSCLKITFVQNLKFYYAKCTTVISGDLFDRNIELIFLWLFLG